MCRAALWGPEILAQFLPGKLSASASANRIVAVQTYAETSGNGQAATLACIDDASRTAANCTCSFETAPVKGQPEALGAGQVRTYRRKGDRDARVDSVDIIPQLVVHGT